MQARHAIVIVGVIVAAQAVAIGYTADFVANATSQAAQVFAQAWRHGGMLFGSLLGMVTWGMGLLPIAAALVGGGVLAMSAGLARRGRPLDGVGGPTTAIVTLQVVALFVWFRFVPPSVPTGANHDRGTAYTILVVLGSLAWIALDAIVLWKSLSGKRLDAPPVDIERMHADALLKSREIARAEMERSRAKVRANNAER